MAENTFDSEATRRAIESANQEIANLIDTFKQQNASVTENLSSSGTALSGNAGSAAQSSFDSNSGETFNKLNSQIDSFMEAISQVTKTNEETTTEVQNIYGDQA